MKNKRKKYILSPSLHKLRVSLYKLNEERRLEDRVKVQPLSKEYLLRKNPLSDYARCQVFRCRSV